MRRPLRVLQVEDWESDAELVVRELKAAGYEILAERVEDASGMRLALTRQTWDVIIADYRLPQFNAPSALKLIQDSNLDIPFIVVSGTIGEDIAVDMMIAGAHDYVMKDNLARLAPAVRREIFEARTRRERRRAEAALRESEARYRALFESAAEAILLLRGHGIVDCNREALYLFRCSRSELLGATLAEYSPPEQPDGTDSKQSVRELVNGALSGQKTQFEWLGQRKGGATFNAEVTLMSIDLEGERYLLGVFKDVTEKRLLEEQLLQNQKMDALGQMAGSIAHSFNDVLTGITGMSELACAHTRRGTELARFLEEIFAAGKRGEHLIRQLLNFSRKQVFRWDRVSLSLVLYEMEGMLQPVIGKEILVEVDVQPDLGSILSDASQIQQVVMSLVTNARDAMPQGGRLTITAYSQFFSEADLAAHRECSPGTYVILEVMDTGTGMPPEIVKRVFDPFFTTKKPGKGTGIGLSLVCGIVRRSRGFIDVHTELGRGSSFKVCFPQEADERVSRNVHVQGPARQPMAATILVVEDDALVKRVYVETLKAVGHNILEANNGEEALCVSQQHPGTIHLLVTELVLPGMSGYELASLLKAERPALEVLAATSYPDEAILRNKLESFGSHVLQKPCAPSLLTERVTEILARRLGQIRILVVDRDPGVRSFLQHVLETDGYRVRLAVDGTQALRIALRAEVSAVISGLDLSEVEGVELVNELRNRWPNMEIIALADIPWAESAHIGGICRADLVLCKPVEADDLLRALRTLLSRHHDEGRMEGRHDDQLQLHFVSV